MIDRYIDRQIDIQTDNLYIDRQVDIKEIARFNRAQITKEAGIQQDR